MAALEDSDDELHRPLFWGAKGGREPKRKRARGGIGGGAPWGGAGAGKEKKGSSAPAAAPASAPVSASRAGAEGTAAAALVGVTVEDADALDCGVCFLPLKAPIFQCNVGHMVCSPCRDKLKATGKCHVCGIATSSYRRCHGMERLLESIHVPCQNATHGCTEQPVYHDQEAHSIECTHAPCHCPGEVCGFVGSTAKLLEHLGAAHGWPCITKAGAESENLLSSIRLRDGFNFLLLADDGCTSSTNEKQQGGTTGSRVQCLLLLNVARQALGRAISVIWIDPHAIAANSQGTVSKEMECELWYSRYLFSKKRAGGRRLVEYYQSAKFSVACTDLSSGLPSLDGCFQFVIPDSAAGDDEKDAINVGVHVVDMCYIYSDSGSLDLN